MLELLEVFPRIWSLSQGSKTPPPPYSSLVFKTLLSNNIFISGVGGDQNRGQTRVSIGLVWSGSTSGVWRILTCRIVITVLVCNRVIKHNRAWMEYRDTSTAFSRKWFPLGSGVQREAVWTLCGTGHAFKVDSSWLAAFILLRVLTARPLREVEVGGGEEQGRWAVGDRVLKEKLGV